MQEITTIAILSFVILVFGKRGNVFTRHNFNYTLNSVVFLPFLNFFTSHILNYLTSSLVVITLNCCMPTVAAHSPCRFNEVRVHTEIMYCLHKRTSRPFYWSHFRFRTTHAVDMNLFKHSKPLPFAGTVQYKSKLLAWVGGEGEVGRPLNVAGY